MPVSALRPAGGHRLAAIVAQHEVAQREILVDVLARGRLQRAVQPRQHTLMRGVVDQRLMEALAQGHAPIRCLDIACIGRTFEDIAHLGHAHVAAGAAFGEIWLGFEKALHFGLRGKTPACEPFQHFGDDRGQRLIAHQQLAMLEVAGIAIAHGRVEDVIALLDAGFHLLDDLPAILFALKLALGGNDGFDEAPLRRVLEIEVQAFDPCPALRQLAAQLDTELRITGETLEIVKDDQIGLARLRRKIGQQRHHARALHEIAAALKALLGGGHAAIDQRRLRLLYVFGVCVQLTCLSDAIAGSAPVRGIVECGCEIGIR
ncbi:hypothetical protein PAF19_10095 [Paracoccus fistulariae]|nr:hypothetical protein [Paracoccus fistulariae]MDB6181705.1 hypothetical protein [Paracoccus fistulariae]